MASHHENTVGELASLNYQQPKIPSVREMNFTKEQSDFLHKFQTLTFDKRLLEGNPSEKADVLKTILAQLHYGKRKGLSEEGAISSVEKEYQEKYASVVDSLDEQTGLNNFAEGALALCSGTKNESQSWKTLSSDRIRKLSCIQKLREANRSATEKLLPPGKENQLLPFCRNKENINKPTSVGPGDFNVKTVPNIYQQGPGFTTNSNKVMNLYGNTRENARPAPPLVEKGFGRGATLPTTDNSNRANRKPLFSNTSASSGYADQFSGRQTNYGPGSRQRMDAVKRPYADNEENCEMDQEQPSAVPNAFKTAREQLNIDQQKKYGGGNRGALGTSSYGTQKKSLGTRRGPSSRFVPPVMNREDNDSNEAANTITRAVLKTGGGGGGGSAKEEFNMEGLDAEKLKGIEPKMVELIMNEIMDNGHEMTWDDIAGLEFAKKTIKEIVVWPMLRPDIFTGLRGPPKGLLLFGPPGTGKTLIGKCIASQSKSTFFCISASSLTSKWVGEGEKMVRALFAVARSQQPAVVFIDEIDSLLTQRTDGENEASRRIKTEFLVQLDGAGTSAEDRILIIGATNRPQEIDEAARRRFVKRLYIPLPELGARRTIILNLLRQQSYQLTQDQLDTICSRTDGFSGADMAALCREAALGPIRDMSFGDIEHIAADQVRPISYPDFEDALLNVKPSVSEKDLDGYLEWNKTFGSGSR